MYNINPTFDVGDGVRMPSGLVGRIVSVNYRIDRQDFQIDIRTREGTIITENVNYGAEVRLDPAGLPNYIPAKDVHAGDRVQVQDWTGAYTVEAVLHDPGFSRFSFKSDSKPIVYECTSEFMVDLVSRTPSEVEVEEATQWLREML